MWSDTPYIPSHFFNFNKEVTMKLFFEGVMLGLAGAAAFIFGLRALIYLYPEFKPGVVYVIYGW